MTPLELVLSRLPEWEQHGDSYQAKCPAHPDSTPSLSISAGTDGKVLVKCFAGCSAEDVVAALNLEMKDLFPREERAADGRRGGTIAATYQYQDETGAVSFEVVRWEPKRFSQRRPVPGRDGDYAWNLRAGWYRRSPTGAWKRLRDEDEPNPSRDIQMPEARRVLYRLPEILAAPRARSALVVEGEKDVETARGLKLLATCNPHGAGKWRPEYGEALRGRPVYVVADKDEPGREHAQAVAAALLGVARTVYVLELPGDAVKDLTDWVSAGGTRETLLPILQAAPKWRAQPPGPTPSGNGSAKSTEQKARDLVLAGKGEYERGCDFAVGEISYQDTDPAMFYLPINGKILTVGVEELRGPGSFKGRYFKSFGMFPVLPRKQGNWEKLVNSWRKRAITIVTPPAASPEAELLEEIGSIVAGLPVGETKRDFQRGHVLMKAGRRAFNMRKLREGLDRRRRVVESHRLYALLRGAGYEDKGTDAAGETVWAWHAPAGIQAQPEYPIREIHEPTKP